MGEFKEIEVNETEVGVSYIPSLCRADAIRRGIDYNIMVAGSSYIGKSTFIESLLHFNRVKAMEVKEAGEGKELRGRREDSMFHEVCDIVCTNNPLSELLEEKIENNIEHMNLTVITTKLVIDEKDYISRVTVYEVGGIGDSSDSEEDWVPLRNIILNRYEEYHVMEESKDKRIHICLYFIEPSGVLREIDIKSMKEVGKICNLIPVIGKSDILSDRELREFKDKISGALSSSNINTFDYVLTSERKKVVELNFLPLRVVGGSVKEGAEGEDGRRERSYGWGGCQEITEDSSDFGKIRNIVISSYAVDLIEKTEKYYEEYRANKMAVNILTGNTSIDDNFRRKIRLEESKLKHQMKRMEEIKEEHDKMLREKEDDLRRMGVI